VAAMDPASVLNASSVDLRLRRCIMTA
jgi:hypothetical protein